MFLRSVIRFSYLSASPFLSPLPLLFLYSLYSSAVCFPGSSSVVCWRYAFSGLSLLPPPPPPLPPLIAFAIFVFISSAPVSLRFLSSFPFYFLASCCCLGSLSLSFSCLFSLLGNAPLQCCLSVWFTFVCGILFVCSGIVLYAPE